MRCKCCDKIMTQAEMAARKPFSKAPEDFCSRCRAEVRKDLDLDKDVQNDSTFIRENVGAETVSEYINNYIRGVYK